MDNLIDLVCRQTNYTREEAKTKLEEFELEPIKVIEDYLGVEKKSKKATSINQEIYRQFRKKMNQSARDYEKHIENKKQNNSDV